MNNVKVEKSWFPKREDFKHKTPVEGWFALHFFNNGLGVQVWRHLYEKEYSYKVVIVTSVIENGTRRYERLENPERIVTIPQLGMNSMTLVKVLNRIKNYHGIK